MKESRAQYGPFVRPRENNGRMYIRFFFFVSSIGNGVSFDARSSLVSEPPELLYRVATEKLKGLKKS